MTYVVDFEVTDTFGGEANYSWINRERRSYEIPPSRRKLVRDLKAFAGFTGLPGRTLDLGDRIEVRPRALLQVAFAKDIY